MDDNHVDLAIATMHEAGVPLDTGLTDIEIASVESEYEFRFAPDHRAFLQAAQPTGDRWVNWRTTPPARLIKALRWPVEGALFDVERSGFWPRSWGPRPSDEEAALERARAKLQAWPKLIPLYGHRYMAAAPAPAGAPVFSVHQTDIIYYGSDLSNYVRRELFVSPATDPGPIRHVSPWADLAIGAENDDL